MADYIICFDLERILADAQAHLYFERARHLRSAPCQNKIPNSNSAKIICFELERILDDAQKFNNARNHIHLASKYRANNVDGSTL